MAISVDKNTETINHICNSHLLSLSTFKAAYGSKVRKSEEIARISTRVTSMRIVTAYYNDDDDKVDGNVVCVRMYIYTCV